MGYDIFYYEDDLKEREEAKRKMEEYINRINEPAVYNKNLGTPEEEAELEKMIKSLGIRV